MSGFRILDQFPAYLDRLGLPVSGGTLRFYETGTDTPKDVFGDPDLTVNNGPTVLIGTDGRTIVDVWGSGTYRVRLYAADNTLIKEADNVQIPGGTGTTIPALVANAFLTNDGSSLLWSLIRQIPDPTGNSAKTIGTDGVNVFWEAKPSLPTATVSDGSFQFAGLLIQWGTGTAPGSSTKRTNAAVTFPKVFGSKPFVTTNHEASINPAGLIGASQAAGIGVTGFTASFDANIDNTGASFNIVSSFQFQWFAIGLASS